MGFKDDIKKAFEGLPEQERDNRVTALCSTFMYQEAVSNPDYNKRDPDSPRTIANPQSKLDFAVDQVVDGFVMTITHTYETQKFQEKVHAAMPTKRGADEVAPPIEALNLPAVGRIK